MNISNDSYVLASDIGDGSRGLLCHILNNKCCRISDNQNLTAQGHWYHPDGSEVMSFTVYSANCIPGAYAFFSRNRDAGIVRLNRYGNPSERGRFLCEIPDTFGDIVNLYVNIGEWCVSCTINCIDILLPFACITPFLYGHATWSNYSYTSSY